MVSSKKCAQCGREIGRKTIVCPECGAQVPHPSQTSLVKLIAILLVCTLAGWMLANFIQSREPAVSVASSAPVVRVADFQEMKVKADGGDAGAQNLLGEMYAKGTGVSQNYTEAAKWYRLAADQGHAAAQKHLAELYDTGQGVPEDAGEAAKWCQRAAEQGYVTAQYSLAVMFTSGRGVKLNDAEAVKWYKRAAEQGNALAQYNLGDRYTTGRSVPQDRVEAYKWLSLAAAQGLPDPMEVLNGLKGSMTSEQIKEAKRRAAAFVPTKSSAVNQ